MTNLSGRVSSSAFLNCNSTGSSGLGNLTLLQQPTNNRQGAARNRGVSVAKGEYICFVDSDDAVTEGVVDAIRLAKEKQADMVAFHTANVNENGQITKENERLSFSKGQVFSGVEMQTNIPIGFPVLWLIFIARTSWIKPIIHSVKEYCTKIRIL